MFVVLVAVLKHEESLSDDNDDGVDTVYRRYRQRQPRDDDRRRHAEPSVMLPKKRKLDLAKYGLDGASGGQQNGGSGDTAAATSRPPDVTAAGASGEGVSGEAEAEKTQENSQVTVSFHHITDMLISLHVHIMCSCSNTAIILNILCTNVVPPAIIVLR